MNCLIVRHAPEAEQTITPDHQRKAIGLCIQWINFAVTQGDEVMAYRWGRLAAQYGRELLKCL